MKIGRFTIWTRTPTPSDAASVLSKRGIEMRRASVREKAIQMCVEGGFPIPDVWR